MIKMTVSDSWCVTAFLLCFLCVWDHPAYAYRPFNSTDAAVAARGEMEIECGPFGYIVDADRRFVVIPSAILNVGIAEGWEVVVEGRNFLLVQPMSAGRRDTLRETALSLKGMLREGSLQENHSGPSIAFEAGVLLPGVGADPGVGASFAGIVSQRWSAITLHVNGELLITREHSLGAFAGAIVEGPSNWVIRPVAEVTLEQDAGRTTSALIGAIWQVRHNLSLDAGWRVARSEGADVREFRAGFTWAFPLGSGSEARRAGPQSAPLPHHLLIQLIQ
jgi:cbb3-type cytochrome oxidase subunit 3